MAPKKGQQPAKGKAAKKQKGPTQISPLERIKVIGPTGKARLEWRPRA